MNRKKLIYSILKELEQNREPQMADYGLDLDKWGEIADLIQDEGYAKNITVSKASNSVMMVWYSHAKITMKGLVFLEDNSPLAKTYKGLKEIKEWIK